MKTIYGIRAEMQKLRILKRDFEEINEEFKGHEFTKNEYKMELPYNIITLQTLRKKRTCEHCSKRKI